MNIRFVVSSSLLLVTSLLVGCHSSDDSTGTPGTFSSSITGILSLPAGLSPRIGIKFGSLSDTQLAAFRDLMLAVLALNTPEEMRKRERPRYRTELSWGTTTG